LGGGGLAYAGITESLALAFDLFDAAPGGIQFVTNGISPLSGQYTLCRPVILTSQDPIQIDLNYDGQKLSVRMTDTVTTNDTFVTNYVIGPISQYLGTNAALVGFTAATGSDSATQTITDFTYVPLPLLTASRSEDSLVITWPVSVGGYSLQQSSSLTSAAWTSVAGPYDTIGADCQVTLPVTGGSQFFRLQLQ
jgi:hypothetical protein